MSVLRALTGNQAAAHGVRLSKVRVISAYPITPQTEIVETLNRFVSTGQLKAEFVDVESEHSALSICVGAEAAGARSFTASASQGVAYMHEIIWQAAGLRLPIVMAVANRSLAAPPTIFCDHSDSMSEMNSGWIQLYAENNQEVLDTIIQAYKIGEDQKVLLPVMVCFDGFFVSHTTMPVDIPTQEAVDSFLPSYEPDHVVLDPEIPMAIGAFTNPSLFTEVRYQNLKGMLAAKPVIEVVSDDFSKRFGRNYAGLMEEYLCKDADALLVTVGSMTGIARVVIDELREKGERIGLIKLRSLRPFPSERLSRAIRSVKAVGLLERNVDFNRGSGSAFIETKAAACDLDERPLILGFVVGLGGREVGYNTLEAAAKEVLQAAKDEKPRHEIRWLDSSVSW